MTIEASCGCNKSPKRADVPWALINDKDFSVSTVVVQGGVVLLEEASVSGQSHTSTFLRLSLLLLLV